MMPFATLLLAFFVFKELDSPWWYYLIAMAIALAQSHHDETELEKQLDQLSARITELENRLEPPDIYD